MGLTYAVGPRGACHLHGHSPLYEGVKDPMPEWGLKGEYPLFESKGKGMVAKIAQDLARAGLIEIRQGARGGFVLSKNPNAISLLEVVETMIGKIHLNDCVARPSGCKASDHCTVHRVWQDARDQLRASLRQVSFEQLIADTSCLPSCSRTVLEAERLETVAATGNELQ
jgi:Rrf2 family protein